MAVRGQGSDSSQPKRLKPDVSSSFGLTTSALPNLQRIFSTSSAQGQRLAPGLGPQCSGTLLGTGHQPAIHRGEASLGQLPTHGRASGESCVDAFGLHCLGFAVPAGAQGQAPARQEWALPGGFTPSGHKP